MKRLPRDRTVVELAELFQLCHDHGLYEGATYEHLAKDWNVPAWKVRLAGLVYEVDTFGPALALPTYVPVARAIADEWEAAK